MIIPNDAFNSFMESLDKSHNDIELLKLKLARIKARDAQTAELTDMVAATACITMSALMSFQTFVMKVFEENTEVK